jgi:hypothetical protein
MTNAIGKGTCNVPINLLVEERAIIGRLAFEKDLSAGEFLRRVIRRGIAMSDPEEAKAMAEVRRTWKRATRVAISVSIVLLALFQGQDLRRVRPLRLSRARTRVEEVA